MRNPKARHCNLSDWLLFYQLEPMQAAAPGAATKFEPDVA
jgi:hypothetical protein